MSASRNSPPRPRPGGRPRATQTMRAARRAARTRRVGRDAVHMLADASPPLQLNGGAPKSGRYATFSYKAQAVMACIARPYQFKSQMAFHKRLSLRHFHFRERKRASRG